MVNVESTKGAPFEKFLVVSCDGKEVLDTALTLQEATTKLADKSAEGACFVNKILRYTDAANVNVFDVKTRPARAIQYSPAAPPHVGTEREVTEAVPTPVAPAPAPAPAPTPAPTAPARAPARRGRRRGRRGARPVVLEEAVPAVVPIPAPPMEAGEMPTPPGF